MGFSLLAKKRLGCLGWRQLELLAVLFSLRQEEGSTG
jgi:hypothetical protein